MQDIRRLEALLRELEAVPAHRREDEVTDVRADMCRRRLTELGDLGHALPVEPVATVEVVDVDELIQELENR